MSATTTPTASNRASIVMAGTVRPGAAGVVNESDARSAGSSQASAAPVRAMFDATAPPGAPDVHLRRGTTRATRARESGRLASAGMGRLSEGAEVAPAAVLTDELAVLVQHVGVAAVGAVGAELDRSGRP